MIIDTLKEFMMATLGAQEMLKSFVEDLVKKGELSESQGMKMVKEWSEKLGKTGSEFSSNISETISKTLEKMNLATKEDIEKLNKKVNSLSARLSTLEGTKKTNE
jgi:polyhydroxyalkanoate synthesis regulator phasin